MFLVVNSLLAYQHQCCKRVISWSNADDAQTLLFTTTRRHVLVFSYEMCYCCRWADAVQPPPNSMIARWSSCVAQLTVANIVCQPSVLPLAPRTSRQCLWFVISASTWTWTCLYAVMSGKLCHAVSLFFTSYVTSGIKYQLRCSSHWSSRLSCHVWITATACHMAGPCLWSGASSP